MRLVLTALLFVGGLFYLFMGTGFLLDPATSGGDFGLKPDGAQGLSSIRADLTAFFWVAGGCMIWGAWKRNGDPLLASAALMGVALLGRVVSILIDGSYAGWQAPVLVEAATVLLCLTGWKLLPHHALNED
ncbi:DUF4345 family protein [Parerythrobacter jejuensis]|uniref:DUF4345 domain-containing protein n=1 Tax=Parerythrobacter jejuensis TaxID=795812 RepID=A0A845AJQ9_9SPHN|nr:DUF4345 family protein [Parerythrobacter jejuensis]MXP30490.1 DUF4345 domain-containing protein [Parerythrobacter jejuensis]MXP33250.1 DUF4345 domain-containing protein [Parerythrobacter jejuensis]